MYYTAATLMILSLIAPLWVLNALLQVGVCVVMVRRGQVRHFMTFFVYIAFATSRTLLLMVLRNHYYLYFWTYWVSDLISVILLTAVLQDLCERLISDTGRIRRWVWLGFFICALLALTIGALTLQWNPKDAVSAVLTAERGLRILQSGLVIAILIALWLVGMAWSRLELQIFCGVAVLVVIELLLVSSTLAQGKVAKSTFFWLNPALHTLAFSCWLYAFACARVDARDEDNLRLQIEHFTVSLQEMSK